MERIYVQKVFLPEEWQGNEYWSTLPAIKGLSNKEGLAFNRPVTILAGENGSGKSTLLEAIAIACGFNPEGGSKNVYFKTEDSHSALWGQLQLVKAPFLWEDGYFLRAESFYNLASKLDSYQDEDILDFYGGNSLHAQSHGESFLSVMLQRFFGNGLYILDEPEAALSPQNQLALLAKIQLLAHKKSQFIIATHSPILMACPNAVIYWLGEAGPVKQKYEDIEHVQIMRSFLENPQRMLRLLLEEEN